MAKNLSAVQNFLPLYCLKKVKKSSWSIKKQVDDKKSALMQKSAHGLMRNTDCDIYFCCILNKVIIKPGVALVFVKNKMSNHFYFKS